MHFNLPDALIWISAQQRRADCPSYTQLLSKSTPLHSSDLWASASLCGMMLPTVLPKLGIPNLSLVARPKNMSHNVGSCETTLRQLGLAYKRNKYAYEGCQKDQAVDDEGELKSNLVAQRQGIEGQGQAERLATKV